MQEWQRGIQLQLLKADNENLGIRDPGVADCAPIPAGYAPAISDTYPNLMAVPLSRPVKALDDPHLLALPKRKKRSKEAEKVRRKARKQKTREAKRLVGAAKEG